jgi:hypothetical protein
MLLSAWKFRITATFLSGRVRKYGTFAERATKGVLRSCDMFYDIHQNHQAGANEITSPDAAITPSRGTTGAKPSATSGLKTILMNPSIKTRNPRSHKPMKTTAPAKINRARTRARSLSHLHCSPQSRV